MSASLAASVFFAVLYAIPDYLDGLDPVQVFAWRVLTTVPFIALMVTVARLWPSVGVQLRRIRRAPLLLLVLLVNAAIFALQQWLFAWGPLTGNALSISLGYFLLPLTLVLAGVVFHRERLSRMRLAAVVFAVAGVAVVMFAEGGVSWATFAVAIGYVPCFLLRRRYGFDTPAGLSLEFALILPLALVLALQPESLAAAVGSEQNIVGLLLLGALGSAGFIAYTLAQRRLPFNLFGMLGYAEPVLLVVVSVLVFREVLTVPDLLCYSAIAVALILLAADGLLARSRMRRDDAAPFTGL